jgi:hypothetical protein
MPCNKLCEDGLRIILLHTSEKAELAKAYNNTGYYLNIVTYFKNLNYVLGKNMTHPG